ncbi:MAG: Type secretion system protein N-terminal domain [Verrucomicrobiota bacterium]|jgi:hypothetical protein
MDPESLITLLVDRELGGEPSPDQIVSDFEASGQEVLDFLTASGFGEREEILRFVAEEQRRPFLDLDQVSMPAHLVDSIDPDILRIFECLPLEVSDDAVKVCMVDPFDEVAVRELAAILGKRVELAIADPEKIRSRLAAIAKGKFEAAPEGLVAASMGDNANRAPVNEAGKRTLLSSSFLATLSVLAIAATASAALYLSQNRRLADWQTLVEKNEVLMRQSDASRKGVEATVFQMEGDLDALEKLVTAKEVDAIKIDALEKELRGLRGKIDSLGKILAKAGEPQANGSDPLVEKSDSP